MGVVVRRYIDILTIIINFPYSICISSFFGSSIPTSLFIFCFFILNIIRRELKRREEERMRGGRVRGGSIRGGRKRE